MTTDVDKLMEKQVHADQLQADLLDLLRIVYQCLVTSLDQFIATAQNVGLRDVVGCEEVTDRDAFLGFRFTMNGVRFLALAPLEVHPTEQGHAAAKILFYADADTGENPPILEVSIEQRSHEKPRGMATLHFVGDSTVFTFDPTDSGSVGAIVPRLVHATYMDMNRQWVKRPLLRALEAHSFTRTSWGLGWR